MKFFLTLSIVFCVMQFADATSMHWDLNDVTYVFPLPKHPDDALFLRGNDFIPRKWFTHQLAGKNGLSFSIVGTSAHVLNDRESATGITDQQRLMQELFEQQIREGNTARTNTSERQRPQQTQDAIFKNITRSEYELTSKSFFDQLRLVAFRVDPCFRDHFEDQCQPQIRVVWQPIKFEEKRILQAESGTAHSEMAGTAVDAAAHTFYNLDSTAFATLTAELMSIKSRYREANQRTPLGVHPGFNNPSFQREMVEFLTKQLKKTPISRIAFMRLDTTEFAWTFLSFDVVKDSLVPVHPAKAMGDTQTISFTSPESGVADRLGDFAEKNADQLFGAIPADLKLNASRAEFTSLKRTALHLENPSMHLPGTTDCVSCHSASGAKSFANLQLKSSLDKDVARITKFIGNYNLANYYRTDPKHFRILGYVGSSLSIGDRVINESALVADQLNAPFNQNSYTKETP